MPDFLFLHKTVHLNAEVTRILHLLTVTYLRFYRKLRRTALRGLQRTVVGKE